jgi:hypothetical protein
MAGFVLLHPIAMPLRGSARLHPAAGADQPLVPIEHGRFGATPGAISAGIGLDLMLAIAAPHDQPHIGRRGRARRVIGGLADMPRPLKKKFARALEPAKPRRVSGRRRAVQRQERLISMLARRIPRK